jgi:hypothetical protein
MFNAKFRVDPASELTNSDGILEVKKDGFVGRLQFVSRDTYISREAFQVIVATPSRVAIRFTNMSPGFILRRDGTKDELQRDDADKNQKDLVNGDSVVLIGSKNDKRMELKLTPIVLDEEKDAGQTQMPHWEDETQMLEWDVAAPILSTGKSAIVVSSRSPTPPVAPKRKRCMLLDSSDEEVSKPAKKRRAPRKPKSDGAAPKVKAPRKPRVRVSADAKIKAPKTPKVAADRVVDTPTIDKKPATLKALLAEKVSVGDDEIVIHDGVADEPKLEELLQKNTRMGNDEIEIRGKKEQRYLNRRGTTSDDVRLVEAISEDDDVERDSDVEFRTDHPDDRLIPNETITALVGLSSKNYVAFGCKKRSMEKNKKFLERAGVDFSVYTAETNEHLSSHFTNRLAKLAAKDETREAAEQALAMVAQNKLLDERFPGTKKFLKRGPRGPVDKVRVHQKHRAGEESRKAALADIEAKRKALKLPIGRASPPPQVNPEKLAKWRGIKQETTDLYIKLDKD